MVGDAKCSIQVFKGKIPRLDRAAIERILNYNLRRTPEERF